MSDGHNLKLKMEKEVVFDKMSSLRSILLNVLICNDYVILGRNVQNLE